MCLTATATDKVVTDVCGSLNIHPVILRGSVDRPNLFYEVRPKGTDSDVLSSIAELVRSDFKNETGIIYVLSRRDAEELAASLCTIHGVRAGCYHGDVSSVERHATYTKWSNGRLQVICATISFGLGIDKQNCKLTTVLIGTEGNGRLVSGKYVLTLYHSMIRSIYYTQRTCNFSGRILSRVRARWPRWSARSVYSVLSAYGRSSPSLFCCGQRWGPGTKCTGLRKVCRRPFAPHCGEN